MKKVKASDMVFLALLAFALQFTELIIEYIIVWTPLIDCVPIGNTWWAFIHRVLFTASWAVGMYLIVKNSKKCGYDPVEKVSGVKPLELIAPALVAFLFIGTFVFIDGGMAVLIEKLGNMDGVIGTVGHIIYNGFHTAVIILVIALAQKAFDVKYSYVGRYLPFGGLFFGACRATENIVRTLIDMIEQSEIIFTSDLLLVILLGTLSEICMWTVFGIVYILASKKTTLAYPFAYLMAFIIG